MVTIKLTSKIPLKQLCISRKKVLGKWQNMFPIWKTNKKFWNKNLRKKRQNLKGAKKDTEILLLSSPPSWKSTKD
jgi:hypothetical protein